jgi:hypothetical protein
MFGIFCRWVCSWVVSLNFPRFMVVWSMILFRTSYRQWSPRVAWGLVLGLELVPYFFRVSLVVGMFRNCQ